MVPRVRSRSAEGAIGFRAPNFEYRPVFPFDGRATIRLHKGRCASQSRPVSTVFLGRIQDYGARRSSSALPTDLPGLRLSLDCDPCAKVNQRPSADISTDVGQISHYGSASRAPWSRTKSAAARFSSKCASDEVPGISNTVGAWSRSQASADLSRCCTESIRRNLDGGCAENWVLGVEG